MHNFPIKKGFTLIELMVVLAIMGTAFALVGPNIMKSYDKVKAQSEVKELTEILKKISYKAFINGRSVDVSFNQNHIQYKYTDSQKTNKVSFNFIGFPEQDLNFTSAGFTNINNLTLYYNGNEHLLSLDEINDL
ncbi:MAG: type II secretion system protein [Thalassotalea sp.]|nr:type II secretion system protein [Thalassotalea sp.]